MLAQSAEICYTEPERKCFPVRCDCHIHMVLDGADWKRAIARHSGSVDEVWVRRVLETYQKLGFAYLRDGGDRWGVGAKARSLAGEYGITYRTPLSPLCAQGHYGGFIGEKYENLSQYAAMVTQKRADGADFIKIMISGLMDFDRFGVLTEDGLPPETIRELIHIAHEEGFAVMAHANGARTVEAAALAGVDSVEHGAYLDTDALRAMRENGTVWVPTLSTIGNLRGTRRFDEAAVAAILESAMENVAAFAAMGGLIAPGTDAGAWASPPRKPVGIRAAEAGAGGECRKCAEPQRGGDSAEILTNGYREGAIWSTLRITRVTRGLTLVNRSPQISHKIFCPGLCCQHGPGRLLFYTLFLLLRGISYVLVG